jgi:hypothetical protein
MARAVYNSAIEQSTNRQSTNLQSTNLHWNKRRALNLFCRAACGVGVALQTFFLILGFATLAVAADWNKPEQELARKIVAVTGPGAVAWTVENRSSLGRRESDIVTNGLHAALEAGGVRLVMPEQAAATIRVVLSENQSSYVWVAEIQQGGGDPVVVMVSTPRAAGPVVSRDSSPLTLRKTPLWSQESRILDVAVLEENVTPTQIAVRDAENIAVYRLRGSKWQQEQSLPLTHTRPWPRDLRGRLVPAKDHLLDAYLPGVACRTAGSPLSMSCHESDDPWPLVAAPSRSGMALNVTPMGGFFASTRNYFTGALAPGVGKSTTLPKFYSAAFIPRDKYVLWLFATVDGQLHMVDGVSDVTARPGWGSDVAGVRTSCGAGWQVLATGASNQAGDSVRAYEFPDRDAVPVSAAVELPGEVTALWTESKGETAVAIVRNRESREYEAFRLAMACDQ